jgi:hypothetical protein
VEAWLAVAIADVRGVGAHMAPRTRTWARARETRSNLAAPHEEPIERN